MTADLIERLSEGCGGCANGREAIEEIGRLGTALDIVENHSLEWKQRAEAAAEALKMANKSYARLEERVDRLLEAAEAREAKLREALKEALPVVMTHAGMMPTTIAGERMDRLAEKMRQALADTKETGDG